MKHEAKALRRLAVMTLLALALPLTLSLAAAAQDPTVDVDGVWGISEEGTDKQGANCDRWASGWGNSRRVIVRVHNSITDLVYVVFRLVLNARVGVADGARSSLRKRNKPCIHAGIIGSQLTGV